MLQIENKTPFAAKMCVLPNENGRDTLVLTVKGSFSWGPVPEILEPAPIVDVDVYWADPQWSSLKAAGELHLSKPTTDILLKGHGQAPDRKAGVMVDTGLQVGELTKKVRVFGDRCWEKGLLGWQISEPVPFETMPLVYERAYGGRFETDRGLLAEERNPAGRGLMGPEGARGVLLPNLENPEEPIQRRRDQPAPFCYGPVAPAWLPRRLLAGSYDDNWIQKRAPFLPHDFDPTFFNTASSGLCYGSYLQGGEPVGLKGFTPEGLVQFNVVRCSLQARVDIAGRSQPMALNIETLELDPDENRYHLVWRGVCDCDKMALKVSWAHLNLQKVSFDGGVS